MGFVEVKKIREPEFTNLKSAFWTDVLKLMVASYGDGPCETLLLQKQRTEHARFHFASVFFVSGFGFNPFQRK